MQNLSLRTPRKIAPDCNTVKKFPLVPRIRFLHSTRMYIFVPHCFPPYILLHCNAPCLSIGTMSVTRLQGEARTPNCLTFSQEDQTIWAGFGELSGRLRIH